MTHPPSGPTKRCPMCRTTKPVEDFPRNRGTRDGRATYCKPCHNERMKQASERLYGGHAEFLRKRRYGIGADEVAELVRQQGGVCAICGIPDPTHIDHSHQTGQVRGILCFSCNRGLGKAGDRMDTLRAMIAYLQTPAAGS